MELFKANFTISMIYFSHQDKCLTLQGTSSPPLIHASFHQFTRLLHTDSIVSCHAITMLPLDTPLPTFPLPLHPNVSRPPATLNLLGLPPDLATILHQFSHVFSTPLGLPPLDPMIIIFTFYPIPSLLMSNPTATRTFKRKPWLCLLLTC